MWILLAIYVLSALACAAINWSAHSDQVKRGGEVLMADKVVVLYIIPLCPIANTAVCISTIFKYFE